ncbi:MAG TPA: asparagine synthase (glutamine-hydrolyzing) [Stellaceae bacterium]|nr:asparagine synthase (glutamine-hydrolyzing) [Stellaceae bacterium]
MCGLAGFFDPGRRLDPAEFAAIARRMAERLAHRGPDDEAVWVDGEAGVGLGFRRLSIIDLSPAGRQPMLSSRGGLVMVYNGEIYNFHALREELAGTPWRGHSDSEVLLAAIERWGFVAALGRLDGMFAIALWDKGARRLWLARDRFGEKPLYYGGLGGVFLFGSELKGLAAHPAWTGAFDREALGLFLRRSYVPAPHSAYAGIKKLPPGHYLSVSEAGEIGAATPYWSAAECAAAAAQRPFGGTLAAAVDRLQALVDAAVASRLEADVPLGAFLSGGIDSSTIAAAMQRARPGSVRTFSIGFPDRAHDESRHAALVAQHLGTTHTSFTVSDAECREVLPRLCEVYDEPFADASQIPTLLLCRLTRSAVKVSLSGDGGDELFGGYSRYAAAARRWRRTERAPRAWRAASRHLARPLAGSNTRPWRRLRKLLEPWGHESAGALYGDYLSRWRTGDGLTPGLALPAPAFAAPVLGALPSLEQAFMLIDATSYLPDDLLVKIDRASMAFGLEARAPLLDPRIAEFAWALPASLAVEGGPKLVLREALFRRVPRALVDRPKQGFEPPIGLWLRGALRDWADDLLAPASLGKSGLVATEVVAARWREHRSGRRNWAYPLWNILMLEAWLGRARKG